jgi:hypothetical protein
MTQGEFALLVLCGLAVIGVVVVVFTARHRPPK